MLRSMRRLVVSAFVVVSTAVAQAPATEQHTGLAAIQVPDGFTVEIAASPALSSYPMFMTFDDRGRLFIAESSGKNVSGKQMVAEPECMILMLEDLNQDGVFDSKKVFADKLTLPMGVQWYQGSLYVANPPDFIRLDDVDGDGIAEKREVLLTGWNVFNTASLHGPFFGPDGWMYLTHGRHGYKITNKEGELLEGLASRIWRCRPDGTQLQRVMGGGFDNPVELIFTPAGETIGTMTYFVDPSNGQRDALMHFVEGGVYPKLHESTAEFTRTGGLMPTMTKFARIAPAGLAQYRGDQFGAEYKGNLFSAQFNPHRVQRHIFTRAGGTYKTEDSDFLTSSDPDFHPTDVLEDADGSLLISDTGGWYVDACPISRVARPEVRGSIYRIRMTGATAPADPWGFKEVLPKKSAKALVKFLDDPRPLVRDNAVELLVKLGAKSVKSLQNAYKASTNDSTRTAIVWALGRINTKPAKDTVRAALGDSSAQVCIAAARVVGNEKDTEAVAGLLPLLGHGDLAVRRQAATALGSIQDVKTVEPLLAACTDVSDRFLEHALIYSLIQLNQPEPVAAALTNPNAPVRKAALIALDQMPGAVLSKAQFAPFLEETEPVVRHAALWIASRHTDWSDLVLAYLDKGLRAPEFTVETAKPLQEVMLAYANDPGIHAMVTALIDDKSVASDRKVFLLDFVNAASVKEFPASWTEQLGRLLDSPEDTLRDRAVATIRTRGIDQFDAKLAAMANNDVLAPAVRLSALVTIAQRKKTLTDAEFAFATGQLAAGNDPTLRQTASKVLVYATLSQKQITTIASDFLPSSDALTFPSLLDTFVDSTDEPVGLAMVSALTKSQENLNLVPSQKIEDLLNTYPETVRGAAKPLRAKAEAEQQARIARLSLLEPQLGTGDVGRGRRIFFGEKVGCYTCHAVGGEGGNVGPDLTTIGTVRSGHDLLEALLFPSASIVPDYETYVIETEWESFSGVIGRQTADSVLLRLAVNSDAEIARKDIKAMTQHPISKMPEGLDLALSQGDLLDLMAFLQSLNKEPWLLPEQRGAKEH